MISSDTPALIARRNHSGSIEILNSMADFAKRMLITASVAPAITAMPTVFIISFMLATLNKRILFLLFLKTLAPPMYATIEHVPMTAWDGMAKQPRATPAKISCLDVFLFFIIKRSASDSTTTNHNAFSLSGLSKVTSQRDINAMLIVSSFSV